MRMFRASMCVMNRSERACCSWSRRIICSFRDDQHGRRGHGGRGLQANGMTRQRPLTEEVTRPEHRHDRLFAAVRLHRELDGALLNVQDAVGRIALGENDVGGLIGRDGLPRPCGTEKRVRVERSASA